MTDVGSPYDQEEHYRRPKGSFTLCLRCALRARVCAVIELTENNDAFTLYDTIRYDKKGKVFPYSLPSVGPGADPGVQAVSPQVT